MSRESLEGGIFRRGQQDSHSVAFTADQTALVPTILELAGQSEPDRMRGQSLLERLDREAQGEGEGMAFCQCSEKNSVFKGLRHGAVGVIDGKSQYQYVLDVVTRKGSLKPLNEAQIRNLDRSAENPGLAQQLCAIIASRFSELVQ